MHTLIRMPSVLPITVSASEQIQAARADRRPSLRPREHAHRTRPRLRVHAGTRRRQGGRGEATAEEEAGLPRRRAPPALPPTVEVGLRPQSPSSRLGGERWRGGDS